MAPGSGARNGRSYEGGVIATYKRPPPAPPRRNGSPYRSSDDEEIVQKMWPDVKMGMGKIFVCGPDGIGGSLASIESTPSTLASKRNPERSRVTEKG